MAKKHIIGTLIAAAGAAAILGACYFFRTTEANQHPRTQSKLEYKINNETKAGTMYWGQSDEMVLPDRIDFETKEAEAELKHKFIGPLTRDYRQELNARGLKSIPAYTLWQAIAEHVDHEEVEAAAEQPGRLSGKEVRAITEAYKTAKKEGNVKEKFKLDLDGYPLIEQEGQDESPLERKWNEGQGIKKPRAGGKFDWDKPASVADLYKGLGE